MLYLLTFVWPGAAANQQRLSHLAQKKKDLNAVILVKQQIDILICGVCSINRG